ncbi:MAG: hypothetical protein ACT4PM_05635 [Gemmatimonadales bacterium]
MALSDPPVRKLLGLLYLAGILMLADQFIEILAALLMGSFAPAPGAATWRFGAFGTVAGRFGLLLIADAFLFAAAIGLEHRVVLRSLGVIHLLLAVITLAALLVFGLDALEVRGRAQPPMAGRVTIAALRAAGLAALAIAIMSVAGVASLRATRKHRHKHGHSREVPTIVDGAPGGTLRS